MTDVFFFGCLHDLGHYFHYLDGRRELRIDGLPWPSHSVDGGFQPPATDEEGQALRHVKDGWTVVAYWDRSVDKRPGSCSALIVHGVMTTPEAVELVGNAFPGCVRVPVVEIGACLS